MERNGADYEGISGFLEEDIRQCALRCASTECSYCGRDSASIKCRHKSCKRAFHLVCGTQNECLFQFDDSRKSFCHEHHGINDGQIEGYDDCMLCWDPLGDYSPTQAISTKQCCNGGWIHLRCMQKTAIKAEHPLNCPLCGHYKEEFLAMIRERGVFVPDQEALKNQPKKVMCIDCGDITVNHNVCNPLKLKMYKCSNCTNATASKLQSMEVSSSTAGQLLCDM